MESPDEGGLGMDSGAIGSDEMESVLFQKITNPSCRTCFGNPFVMSPYLMRC